MSELDKFLSEVEERLNIRPSNGGPDTVRKLIAIVKELSISVEQTSFLIRESSNITPEALDIIQIRLESAIAKSNAIAKGEV